MEREKEKVIKRERNREEKEVKRQINVKTVSNRATKKRTYLFVDISHQAWQQQQHQPLPS